MTTFSENRPIRRALPHLAALIVIVACLRLAVWQGERAEEKADLLAHWDSADTIELAAIGDEAAPRFAEVSASGHFDTRRHVLLDNQVRNNHPGVHVFTPFHPDGSEHVYMVNRGWHPWDRRSGAPPEFATPDGPVTIRGRLNDPPRVGLKIGEAEPLDTENWPNLMTYFETDKIQAVLGEEVREQVLLLDPDHPDHLSGDDWQLVTMGPERHQGYAFQWFSIALAVFLIWLILTVRPLIRRRNQA